MKEKILKHRKEIIVGMFIVAIVLIGTIAHNIFAKNIKDNNSSPQQTIQSKYELVSDEDDLIAEQFEIIEDEFNEGNDEDKKKDKEKQNMGPSYLIRINKSANVINIYTKDEEGNYTVPIKAMTCSTGYYTPSCGKYPKSSYKTTGGKRRWALLEGGVYGQYATQIVGNILFHSVPYLSQEPSSLEYWAYDKLGTTASAGCIRLTVADAQWIYNNISGGTTVEFYSDSNPGPFGKPYAQKISDNVECRGWDPTDSTEGNPWRNISVQEKVEEAQTVQNNSENQENIISEKELVPSSNIFIEINTETANSELAEKNEENVSSNDDNNNYPENNVEEPEEEINKNDEIDTLKETKKTE